MFVSLCRLKTPAMSPFCCHLRTHLVLGYIRSVCTLTAHECRNISFFLCSETVLRDFLRKKMLSKHLSKRDANYNPFKDQYSLHLDTLMPYRVIHVDTPFTSAWSFYICDHLKQWDPTIDLLAVLDLCPLFCSTSVLSIKVRQHWKETPKTKKHCNWQKSLRTLDYTINMPI